MALSSRDQRGLRAFAIAVTVLVMVVVVAGLIAGGNPSVVRQKKGDRQRVEDLQSISTNVRSYYTREKKLPASLEELQRDALVFRLSIRDARSGKLYEYRVLDEQSYELCAEFERDTTQEQERPRSSYQEPSVFWKHSEGRHCYQLEIKEKD